MELKLLYAGFDTMDVAFAGALPIENLATLEQARGEAQERQKPILVTIGPGKVSMHVSGYGMRGGYAFIVDTGPIGAKWMFKKNSDSRQWNIFASPRATMLLAYGYEGTRDRLFRELEAMGAKISNHSINRVDFAMDFQVQDFELHLDQFVAHAHTKVTPHWGTKTNHTDHNQPAAVIRGRSLESVTIGKMPGRQIIVYDKRREAIERKKYFWFKAWDIDKKNPGTEVWRVEIRAGKKELKERWNIRTFRDLENAIGDVCFYALKEIRYLADHQTDSNVTRNQLHPLWRTAQEITQWNLADYRSGLLPGQIIEITRELAIEQYENLIFGNAVGLGVSLGLSDKEIIAQLPELVSVGLETTIKRDETRLSKAVQRAQGRLHFTLTNSSR